MKAVVDIGTIWEPELTIEVDIPPGWRRVFRGIVLTGDRYLHVHEAEAGRELWVEITEQPRPPSDQAQLWSCLIRRGEPVDEACERCRKEPRIVGERYCEYCRKDVIKEIRRKRRH